METMNNKTTFNFLILALVSLMLGMFAGLFSGMQYMLPDFLKEFLPFSQMREFHVSLNVAWIILAATGGVYFYISKENENGLAKGNYQKWHFRIYLLTGVLILLSLFTKNMGGREYMTYSPYLYFPIILGWVLFAINYYKTIVKNISQWPVYLWMWMTGILFMILTYTEAHLWVLPFFRDSVIRDVTVQWKSYGAMVGSWNMLIYGTAIYLMSKIKGDDSIARGKVAFFFYFLGLTNLMFGWAHHTYIIPHKAWIRILAYGTSMTEWIIIGSMIIAWSNSLKSEQKKSSLAYRWLISTDVWVFINLVLALLISIPAINLFTHGTHITVAHSMGTTIGINTTILFASIFYILFKQCTFCMDKYKRQLNFAFYLFHSSFFVFFSSLLYAGYQKGLWVKMVGNKPSFTQMHESLMPAIHTLVASGFLLFVAVLLIAIPLIKALRSQSK
jgi:nitric oxide reductase subunit B